MNMLLAYAIILASIAGIIAITMAIYIKQLRQQRLHKKFVIDLTERVPDNEDNWKRTFIFSLNGDRFAVYAKDAQEAWRIVGRITSGGDGVVMRVASK